MKNLMLCFSSLIIFVMGCAFPSEVSNEYHEPPIKISQRSLTSGEIAMVEYFNLVSAGNYESIDLAIESQIDSVEYELLSLTHLLSMLGIDTQEYKDNADVFVTKILEVLEIDDIDHISELLQNAEINYLSTGGEYPPVLGYGMPCTTEYHMAYIDSWETLAADLSSVMQGLENGITNFIDDAIDALWRHGVRISKAYGRWRDCMGM